MGAPGLMLMVLAGVAGLSAGVMTSTEEALMMQNMTLASAVKVVGKRIKDPVILELIQSRLSDVTVSHQGKGHLRSSAKALEPSGYSGVEGATAKLNEMILESEQKLDLEDVKCQMFNEEQKAIMEETRQDIAVYNAVAASARANILAAMTTIEVIETKLPELHHVLMLSLNQCSTDLAALKGQLTIVEGDIEIMGLIIDMTECSTSSSLLQCKHQKGHARVSFLTLGHSVIRTKIAQLKSASVREGVQKALAASLSGNTTSGELLPVEGIAVDSTPPVEKQVAKCTVAGSPNCPLLRGRFIDIQAGIVDKRDELKRKIAALEQDCFMTRLNLMAQISEFESKLKKAQTHLAESTERLNDATEQSRLKQQQLAKVMREWLVEMARCKETIQNLKTEICGLKKIRQEILKIGGTSLFLQDCEVSDWIATECSRTCGGGQELLFRKIIIQSVGGAACPPLTMTKECGMEPCPIHCELTQWTGYSDCSAKCGGGIQMRTRQIAVQPENGGEQCGATSENRECGVESCDKDCELNDWTSWGGCSKACGGGFQTRTRSVLTPAEGQGTCPHSWSELRMELTSCNQHVCEPQLGATLVCESKLDVIILLDGSASLGEEGWSATLEAGEMLVKAFKAGETYAQVGVIVYSGPSSYSTYYKCMEGSQDSIEECGISWVSHFTTDTDALAEQIKGLAFPGGSTFTSMALATAEADLRNGREDAQALVIVVTDGRPLSTQRTFEASRNLREKARLMWVAVGAECPVDDMKEWASQPVRDNMIELVDFEALEAPESITAIIADACPLAE